MFFVFFPAESVTGFTYLQVPGEAEKRDTATLQGGQRFFGLDTPVKRIYKAISQGITMLVITYDSIYN